MSLVHFVIKNTVFQVQNVLVLLSSPPGRESVVERGLALGGVPRGPRPAAMLAGDLLPHTCPEVKHRSGVRGAGRGGGAAACNLLDFSSAAQRGHRLCPLSPRPTQQIPEATQGEPEPRSRAHEGNRHIRAPTRSERGPPGLSALSPRAAAALASSFRLSVAVPRHRGLVRDQGSQTTAKSSGRPPGNVKRGAREGARTAGSSLPRGDSPLPPPLRSCWYPNLQAQRRSAPPGPNEAPPLPQVHRCVQSACALLLRSEARGECGRCTCPRPPAPQSPGEWPGGPLPWCPRVPPPSADPGWGLPPRASVLHLC